MRKLLCVVLLLALLAALTLPAAAAGELLNMTAALSADGETVTVTVTLKEKTVAEAMGITYTYDESVAEPLPDQCAWVPDSTLEDFSATADQGVWATDNARDVQGDICRLVFRVKDKEKVASTAFGCVLEIQDGAGNLTEYRASTTLSGGCAHSYGPWQDRGELGHSRGCGLCGETQTQSHSWDGGVIHTGEAGDRVKVTTCTLCHAEKRETLTEGQPQQPTQTEPPAQTQDTRPQPSFPSEVPEETHTEPTQPSVEEPTEKPGKEPEKPTEQPTSGQEDTRLTEPTEPEPDNSFPTEPDREEAPTEPPMILPAAGTQPPAEPETTGETETTPENPEAPAESGAPAVLSLLAVLLALSAAGVGIALYRRRKK